MVENEPLPFFKTVGFHTSLMDGGSSSSGIYIYTYIYIYICIYIFLFHLIDGWMDGCMYGWLAGWMDMDLFMDSYPDMENFFLIVIRFFYI